MRLARCKGITELNGEITFLSDMLSLPFLIIFIILLSCVIAMGNFLRLSIVVQR